MTKELLTLAALREFQRIAVEETRLGIPFLFVEEAPHGLMALGEPGEVTLLTTGPLALQMSFRYGIIRAWTA